MRNISSRFTNYKTSDKSFLNDSQIHVFSCNPNNNNSISRGKPSFQYITDTSVREIFCNTLMSYQSNRIFCSLKNWISIEIHLTKDPGSLRIDFFIHESRWIQLLLVCRTGNGFFKLNWPCQIETIPWQLQLWLRYKLICVITWL